ncbi:MAG: alginate lyase family protein [Planctomycetota bacterium]|jgi:hypothetical protein
MEGLKRGGRVCLSVWTIGVIAAGTAGASSPGSPRGAVGIWITPQEIAALPAAGPAWAALLEEADEPAGIPDLSDLHSDTDVRTMAKALVFSRTGEERYRQEVIQTCLAAIGTEDGGRTLALGRNLIGYVIAADLVGLPPADDAVFRAWLADVRYEELDGRTLISTHEDRPNNWGTHAGASRLAAAVYLGDTDDLDAAATVLQGWLGDREAYAGFDYGELWWQADPEEPVGINPAGATIQGHPVGGVLPDDQRRGGPFKWPPPRENYVYTALQGALAQAVILNRQGHDAFNWEDRALLRAFTWLHTEADYPAVGDDTWQPHVVNHQYGTLFPAPTPSRHGKNVGWTDWTHASCNADLDGDGLVGLPDLLALVAAWGTDPGGAPDFNRNGAVRIEDLLALLVRWGQCD